MPQNLFTFCKHLYSGHLNSNQMLACSHQIDFSGLFSQQELFQQFLGKDVS